MYPKRTHVDSKSKKFDICLNSCHEYLDQKCHYRKTGMRKTLNACSWRWVFQQTLSQKQRNNGKVVLNLETQSKVKHEIETAGLVLSSEPVC